MSNTQNKRRKQPQNTFWVAVGLAAMSGVTMAFTLLIADPGSEYPVLKKSAPASSPVQQSSEAMSRGKAAAVTPNARIAERIQRRLQNRDLPVPGVAALSAALAQRRDLLGRSVTVTLATTDGSAAPAPVTVSLAEHPDWIAIHTTSWSAEFHVADEAVQAAVARGDLGDLKLRRDSEVTPGTRDHKQILRASATAIAQAGYDVDAGEAAAAIAAALNDGIAALQLEAAWAEPGVTIVRSDGTRDTLTLLSTGMSDFNDSSADREHNVYKALFERLQNVVIEPGETFSIVAALDAPITLQKGWKEEKGLFGGGVALTPGAGICQSAVTLYRAALLAGLPVTNKKAHSLFVDHYEFFGIGLDATVFPGVQDLVFKNDTSDVIVVQARTEGKTAYINFFGRDDGRTADLDGPYFAVSKDRPREKLRPLSHYQIGWVRTITYADGRTKEEELISTYAKPLWNALYRKYDVAEGMTLLTQRESTKIEIAKREQQIAEAATTAHAAAPEMPVSADVVGQ